ncbi:hypothetical protein OY671_008956, partial [Metschnikowia pulcherrima]
SPTPRSIRSSRRRWAWTSPATRWVAEGASMKREFKVPGGTTSRCKGWRQEASSRLSENVSAVGEDPANSVVYGSQMPPSSDWSQRFTSPSSAAIGSTYLASRFSQREASRQSEKLTAMGSSSAGVAHESNNPSSIVMGRAASSAEKMADDPRAADAHRIHEAAQRCGRIVRTFLNMARSRPANRSEVALNDLATAAVDMSAYVSRSHGIHVESDSSPGSPPVKADA